METNLSTGLSASSDTRQGRSEKRAFPRKRVSVRALGNNEAEQTVGMAAYCPPYSPLTCGCSSAQLPALVSWSFLASLTFFPE